MTGNDPYLDTLTDEQRDLEIERSRRIDNARAVLTASLGEALWQTRRASEAIGELFDMYDVEYAEGSVGDDIRHHLADAARAMRAAYALHRQADPA